MITVTPRVRHALRILAQEQGVGGQAALRLSVRPDDRHPGQTRLRYVATLAESAPQPSDQVFGDEELRVLVAQEDLGLLDGMELDAHLEAGRARLVFRNPHARHTCRCGDTFSPE
jgi:iron-sulfur cluster assembly protein